MTPDQIKEFISIYPTLEDYFTNGPLQEASIARKKWETAKAEFDEIIFHEVRQAVASMNV